MNERTALAVVNQLVEQAEYECADCGQTVDLSEADTPFSVVVALENHRQTHSEGEP